MRYATSISLGQACRQISASRVRARTRAKADGIGMLMCGYCSGDTPCEPDIDRQHVSCLHCGGQMLVTREADGLRQIAPLVAGIRGPWRADR